MSFEFARATRLRGLLLVREEMLFERGDTGGDDWYWVCAIVSSGINSGVTARMV